MHRAWPGPGRPASHPRAGFNREPGRNVSSRQLCCSGSRELLMAALMAFWSMPGRAAV